MKVAFDKNYPTFNLKDTFIYSKDFTTSLSPRILSPIKKPNKNFLTPVISKNSFTDNNLSQISTSLEKPFKPSIIKEKTKNLVNILSYNQLFDISEEFNPNGIVEHLNFLQKTSETQKPKLFLMKLKHKRHKNNAFKSMDLQSDSSSKLHEHVSKTEQKKGYLELEPPISGLLKKKTAENLDNNQIMKLSSKITFVQSDKKDENNSNQGSSNSKTINSYHIQKTNYRKKTILKPPNRMNSIPDYYKLLETLRKLYINFNNLNDNNLNKPKLIQLLHSFIPEKKKYLEKLFFIGDKINPLLNEKTLEKACIVQENQWGYGFKERLIRPFLISDLQTLNDKIEELNIKKEMTEIRYLEENLKETFNEVSKLKSKEFWLSNIESLNYENIKANTIIDDLMEAEKNFGAFECIAQRGKQVGKLIDETIKNINNCNKRDNLEMKYLQQSYKILA